MTAPDLRQRSPTELVDAAFQVYRREPLQFILGLGLIYVPWMVLVGALGLQRGTQALPAPGTAFFVGIGGIVVYTFAAGVTTVIANDVYFGRPADLGRAFRSVATHFFTLVLTMIAQALALFVGFVLLIVPVFYMYARYFAIKQIVLIENTGTNATLRRTAELSKGQKRHILNTIILIGVVYFAISLGVGLLVQMIPSTLIQLVISTIVSTMVYPMFGITETLLYYDLRIRKEGFDIEYLATEFSPASVPA